ncbi:MAG: acyl-CoA dehydrogenase [Elusimicrobia bacterium]|nr:MAG: acyl-CoA dehydrogenase [Elusimicrobiota bacterium]
MAEKEEFKGAVGTNYFETDPLVRGLVCGALPDDRRETVMEELSAFGAACGGELASLITTAHRDENKPKIDGNRVVYCAEQVQARRKAMDLGLLPPVPLVERMTKAYLLNQNGEGGITCPLAMTDGLVALLESHGSADQKKRYLPLLRDSSVDTPLTAGQFVTEKQGGSNVSENETRAVQQADGSWRLTGLKWFCSNPGDLWVTTAKPEGSEIVGLFLVPRLKPDGSPNTHKLLDLKNLSGTYGKATAEIEYEGTYAESIGRPSHGLAILLGSVLKTSRIHVAAASLGFGRRALVEATTWGRERIVLKRPIHDIPHVRSKLDAMKDRQEGATMAVFRMFFAVEAKDPSADVLIPLLKIGVSRDASRQVRDARLLFAGNAVDRDFSILPRLSEDALIQEIWEGTHPILAGQALKALRRQRSRDAFLAILPDAIADLLSDRLGDFSDDESVSVCIHAYESLKTSLLRSRESIPG